VSNRGTAVAAIRSGASFVAKASASKRIRPSDTIQQEIALGSNRQLPWQTAYWFLYSRESWFNGMIADIKQTISRLNGLGITVVLLGVQFKSGLPSILIRTHLRHIDARPEDFVLPAIFSLDQKNEIGAAAI
jgi:hypothetical protein